MDLFRFPSSREASMSKEGVSVNTESVLRENETKANHMLTLI